MQASPFGCRCFPILLQGPREKRFVRSRWLHPRNAAKPGIILHVKAWKCQSAGKLLNCCWCNSPGSENYGKIAQNATFWPILWHFPHFPKDFLWPGSHTDLVGFCRVGSPEQAAGGDPGGCWTADPWWSGGRNVQGAAQNSAISVIPAISLRSTEDSRAQDADASRLRWQTVNGLA